MILKELTDYIESFAPLCYQESYDNSGLLIGSSSDITNKAIISLDVTEAVMDEAITEGADLVIAHHPLIFRGIKNINNNTETGRCIIKAIKNGIAVYIAHTNLDNIITGVNNKICNKLGLVNCEILSPVNGQLSKLVTFIPMEYKEKVQEALFSAGAGHIGNYDSCGFTTDGTGSFRGNEASNPFTGSSGKLHFEPETRFETIFPSCLKNKIVKALLESHPYEEVAYDIYQLDNRYQLVGSGMTGELPEETGEEEFLRKAQKVFKQKVIRHSPLIGKKVKRVAVCGGAGSFLIPEAIRSQSTVFLTGDLKYHQFFEAENKIVLADIGHFESEQYTCELFYELIMKKFPNFAVRLTEIDTNPVNYLI